MSILTRSETRNEDNDNIGTKTKINGTVDVDTKENTTNKTKIRCMTCNKKLSISTFMDCKCGGIYCGAHRYADQHNCSFDHKNKQIKNLEKTLVKLNKNKIGGDVI